MKFPIATAFLVLLVILQRDFALSSILSLSKDDYQELENVAVTPVRAGSDVVILIAVAMDWSFLTMPDYPVFDQPKYPISAIVDRISM